MSDDVSRNSQLTNGIPFCRKLMELYMAYRTLGMLESAGFNKDTNDHMAGSGAPYFSSRERGPYSVEVRNGLLMQNGAGGLQAMDTSVSANGVFIFVMGGDGAILSGDKSVVMHHSSFLAGRAVAAAGTWAVRQGRLEMISDQSGHYQTPIDYVEQVLKELKRRGVNVNTVRKSWVGLKSRDTAKALKRMGVPRRRLGDKGFASTKF
jgi:hypothetical protein